MKTQLFKLTVILLLAAGCKKDNESQPTPVPTPQSSLTININYEADGKALLFDTLLYVTDAGYRYSVSTLKYYLSEICFIKQDSSKVQILGYHYTDAILADKNTFSVTNVPDGNYIGISFNIGLDSLHNTTGALPNVSDNITMEWPDAMGGGYHFMKFEGHYESPALTGFAMHIGKNANLVRANPLYKVVSIVKNQVTLNITMNLNEWFRTPAIYDFNADGSSPMGSMMAMQKLAANGVDVFHYKN